MGLAWLGLLEVEGLAHVFVAVTSTATTHWGGGGTDAFPCSSTHPSTCSAAQPHCSGRRVSGVDMAAWDPAFHCLLSSHEAACLLIQAAPPCRLLATPHCCRYLTFSDARMAATAIEALQGFEVRAAAAAAA